MPTTTKTPPRKTQSKTPAKAAPKAPVVRRNRKPKAAETAPTGQGTPVQVPDERDTPAVGGGVSVASVPSKAVAEAYVHRTFPGGHSDFDLFDFAHKARKPLLIEGPTGPGKTMATRAWAATHGKMLARVPGNMGIEPSQLFGKYVPDEEKGGFKWVDGPVTHVVRHGGVLLLNEVNFIPDRVGSVLFGLLDGNREIVLLDRDGEVVKAHDDLLIVADMNPDYEGTRPLNKAFRNRFGLQLVWDYDPNVEKSLVKSANLLTMAQQIRAEASKGTYDTPVSTNMLMEFESIVEGLGLAFAFTNFINHFNADERSSIRLVCDTHAFNIEQDYKKATAPEADDEADDEVDEGETYDARNTKYDPEWDVHGVDWVFADEA